MPCILGPCYLPQQSYLPGSSSFARKRCPTASLQLSAISYSRRQAYNNKHGEEPRPPLQGCPLSKHVPMQRTGLGLTSCSGDVGQHCHLSLLHCRMGPGPSDLRCLTSGALFAALLRDKHNSEHRKGTALWEVSESRRGGVEWQQLRSGRVTVRHCTVTVGGTMHAAARCASEAPSATDLPRAAESTPLSCNPRCCLVNYLFLWQSVIFGLGILTL